MFADISTYPSGIYLDELERIALATIGKNTPCEEQDDWCDELWYRAMSTQKRKAVDAFESEEHAGQGTGAGADKKSATSARKKSRKENHEGNSGDMICVAAKSPMRNILGKPLVPIENIQPLLLSDAKEGTEEKTQDQILPQDEEKNRHSSAEFLEDSWIWLSDPRSLEFRDESVAQSIAANAVHSFAAFLTACGWTEQQNRRQSRTDSMRNKKRGIILVEKAQTPQYVEKLGVLERGLADRKPIFIFNLSTFSKDCRQEGDISRKCIATMF